MLKGSLRALSGIALVALLGIALLAGCSSGDGQDADQSKDSDEQQSASDEKDKKSKKGEEEEEDDKRVPVEVAEVGRGRIEEVLRFTTNLEAESEVQVFSQAARQITQLYVEEGDDVRRGQVLVRLEDDAQSTQVTRVESQLAKARREYERQQNLYEQQLISEQVFNEATYDLEQLELALSDARRELGYTEVRAPISGTVTQRLVNVGDQITVNQHLFDIIDFDSIVARVYVPEKALPRLAKGQTAKIRSDAFGDEVREGSVQRIAPLVDSRSGTVKATVSIPRGQDLLPGMYVSVELITATHEEAVLIPKRALVYDDEQVFVFRLREGVVTADTTSATDGDEAEATDETPAGPQLLVERVLVRPVLEDRDFIEPGDELSVGDRIVVAGQAGLKNDAVVRIVGGEA